MTTVTLDHAACAHCGLPVPGADPGALNFCCPGCRTVHGLMREAGLGEFYALRDRLGEGGSGPAVVDEAGVDAYARYDDPAFAERFVRGDGECREVELHVEGAHCTACVWLMERLPRAVPGLVAARLDFGRQRIWLRWRVDAQRLSSIAGFLHRLGYPTRPRGAEAQAAQRQADRADLWRMGAMLAVAGNVMLLSFALYAGEVSGMEPRFARLFEWLALVLAIPAVTWGAWPFYRGALAGLRLGSAHIDLPISLGIAASFAASVVNTARGEGAVYFDTVTALVALLLVGRYVQHRGQRAAMNRGELLSALTPPVVRRWTGEGWARVEVGALAVGDRLRVEAGETLPADGVVRGGVMGDGAVHDGAGFVDTRLLTGEARPVAVGPGDRVYAGTICAAGPIEVVAEAVGENSRLGALVGLLDRADAGRAPIARAADRLSAGFVVAVIALAAIGGAVWSVVDPGRAFEVVIALLVVSCPCALGMATPIALAVARRRAADAGILLRSTEALERLARVERVWFDKTGTLTEGRMTVAEADVPARWIAAIGAIERRAQHPVGRAIVAWAEAQVGAAEVDAVVVDSLAIHAGCGISAVVSGQHVGLRAPAALTPALAAAVARGETPVTLVVDGLVAGHLTLADAPRADAAATVARLTALGIQVGLLSGDHPRLAEALGERLGIRDARGGVSPEQKALVVAGAAMVGDGFNDAPALRAAEVGIAVHGGAEVAMEVADVYLSRPGAAAVADAIEGARRALATVRRGLWVSLGYNVVFATLALAGQVSPLVAAVLMPVSSLTVIGHAVAAPSFRRRVG